MLTTGGLSTGGGGTSHSLTVTEYGADLLIGDPSKAREKLGWKPEVGFPELVSMMVKNDLQLEAAKAGVDIDSLAARWDYPGAWSAGGFGIGMPSRLERGGPHGAWGFDSLTLRSRSNAHRSLEGRPCGVASGFESRRGTAPGGSIPSPSAIRGTPNW